MSVVRTIYKYATLGQDTSFSRELTDSTRPSTEYFYCHSWRNWQKHVQERSVHERIMAATFGRLLRSVGFLLYLCWSVKLSVKQNGSWGTCKIINYLDFLIRHKNAQKYVISLMRIVKWNLTLIGSVPMPYTLSLLWFYPSLIYRVFEMHPIFWTLV
jgi:hypothetical protein